MSIIERIKNLLKPTEYYAIVTTWGEYIKIKHYSYREDSHGKAHIDDLYKDAIIMTHITGGYRVPLYISISQYFDYIRSIRGRRLHYIVKGVDDDETMVGIHTNVQRYSVNVLNSVIDIIDNDYFTDFIYDTTVEESLNNKDDISLILNSKYMGGK